MKNLISLTWILFNSHYSISKNNYFYFKKKERRWEPVLFLATIIILIVSLGPYYIDLLNNMYSQYASVGMSEMFIIFAFFVSSIIGLFLGLFSIINTFFFSSNLRILVPLPLKPSEVIFSKFLIVLFDQLLISFIILLPSLIIYGINENVGFLFWIYSFFIFLLSQIFPIGFISVILLPLSRIFKFKRHRDSMVFVVGIIILVLSLFYVQFTMTISTSELESSKDFVDMYIVQNQLMNSIGRSYPPAIMASKALRGSGFISFLWFLGYLGINMGLFVLLIFFGNKFYYSAYSEIQENYASRKELSHEELDKKIISGKSKISALVTREWRYFLRVPSFSFNGLASVFIFPILIIIFGFSLNSSPDFAQIKTFIDKYSYFYVPVAIIISVLSSSLNSVASSVISREGKLVSELKSLPVSYRDIFISKFIHVSEITFMGIFFSTLVLGFLLKLNIFEIIMIIIIGFINSSFLNALQMLVDVSRPKLTWDNPQKAMKQNLNVAISIPIVFGYSFILGFLGFILMNSVNQWIISILFMVLGALGFYFIYRILIVAFKKFADKDISFIS